MQLRKLAGLLLLCSASAFGQYVSNTSQFDVRTTGNDLNGGCFDPAVVSPGTDYSQQNSAQVAYSDLVDPTTTTLTSAAHPFTSADVGNCIYLNGGGTWTQGWFTILSVSGSTATMSATVNATSGDTGGAGNLGGALADFATAYTAAVFTTACNAGQSGNDQHVNTIWMQGSYTVTLSQASDKCFYWIGYGTTHGDSGRATYTISTSPGNGMLNLYGVNLNVVIANIIFNGTSSMVGIWPYGGNAPFGTLTLVNDKFSGFAIAVDNSNTSANLWQNLNVFGCEFTGQTTESFQGNSGGGRNNNFVGNYFHGNNEDLKLNSGSAYISRNIFTGATGTTGTASIYITNGGSTNVQIVDNIFYDITAPVLGAIYSVSQNSQEIYGNIFWGNDIAINFSGQLQAQNPFMSFSNAFGNNTSPNAGWANSASDVTLTANPFAAPGSGNFALNSTAGGGALLKGANYPSTTLWGSTGHLDIGAYQSGGGSTSSASNFGFAH